MEKESLVWYASYGSNLRRARFMCYIEGGTPEGSTREEVGCKDNTQPRADEKIKINHSLYFAENGEHWENKGVAFINKEEDAKGESATLGRMYLITKEQFMDVVAQENRLDKVSIDLDDVKRKKSFVFRQSWYGNILYLGEHKGSPIFTFTTYKKKEETEFNEPSVKYLHVIAAGLMEAWSMNKEQIRDYLTGKGGISSNLLMEALFQWNPSPHK